VSWIVHRGFLQELQPGEQPPPEAVRVEVPADFLENPERYTMVGERLVERSDPAVEAEQRREVLKLTQEEIAKVKEAIEEGRL